MTKLDSHLFNSDQEISIQNREFYEDQISSMVMDSQVKIEEQFERSLKEFLYKEDVNKLLVDEEAHETINLSSSIELPYTFPTNSSLSPPSPYYTLYKLELKMKFLYQAHHSKPNRVDHTCQMLSYHVKLENTHNQDPYMAMYVIYYGQNSFFDKHFSNSQAEDYKSSTSFILFLLVFFYFILVLFLFLFLFCFRVTQVFGAQVWRGI